MHIIRRIFCPAVWLMGLFITSFWADAKDLTKSVSLSFDKAGIPVVWYLLDWEDSGAPFNEERHPDSVDGMVCGSASNTTYGACNTTLTKIDNAFGWSPAPDFGGVITLKMTSSTGKSADVPLRGYYGNGCRTYILWEYFACGSDNPLGVRITAPQSVLALLSSGTWTGTLKLYQRHSASNNTNMGTWTIGITIKVTDTGSQQIFFPAFPTSAPRISLALNSRPGAGSNTTLGGRTTLDMCLYDGSNSTSRRISLLFQDEGSSATGRPAGQFSVYRDGGDKTRVDNRIDYQVSVLNPVTGAPQDVNNGTEIIWTNTDARNLLRQVVLPGVPGTSLCVPAPLTLVTPLFSQADKASGHYTGRLRIIYAPTTQT